MNHYRMYVCVYIRGIQLRLKQNSTDSVRSSLFIDKPPRGTMQGWGWPTSSPNALHWNVFFSAKHWPSFVTFLLVGNEDSTGLVLARWVVISIKWSWSINQSIAQIRLLSAPRYHEGFQALIRTWSYTPELSFTPIHNNVYSVSK